MNKKNKSPKKRKLKHPKVNRTPETLVFKRLEKLKENQQEKSLVAQHLRNRLKELFQFNRILHRDKGELG